MASPRNTLMTTRKESSSPSCRSWNSWLVSKFSCGYAVSSGASGRPCLGLDTGSEPRRDHAVVDRTEVLVPPRQIQDVVADEELVLVDRSDGEILHPGLGELHHDGVADHQATVIGHVLVEQDVGRVGGGHRVAAQDVHVEKVGEQGEVRRRHLLLRSVDPGVAVANGRHLAELGQGRDLSGQLIAELRLVVGRDEEVGRDRRTQLGPEGLLQGARDHGRHRDQRQTDHQPCRRRGSALVVAPRSPAPCAR